MGMEGAMVQINFYDTSQDEQELAVDAIGVVLEQLEESDRATINDTSYLYEDLYLTPDTLHIYLKAVNQ